MLRLVTVVAEEMGWIMGEVFAEEARLGKFELDLLDGRINGDGFVTLELIEAIDETDETEVCLDLIGPMTGVDFELLARLWRRAGVCLCCWMCT